MATSCRRLAALLSRNVLPFTCRVHHGAQIASSSIRSEGHVCRPHTLTGSHLYSTKASEETVVVEEPPGMFKRFWKFMHSDESEYQYHMSEREREERDEIIKRVQAMYFADPPMEPDLEVYKDVIKTLIKYNDRIGVEILSNLVKEMKIEPDEEFTFLVEPFLERMRREED